MTKHATKSVINAKAVTDFANSQRAFAISSDAGAIALASEIEVSRGENVILAEIARVALVLRKKELKIQELQNELSSRDDREGLEEYNSYIFENFGSPQEYDENVLTFYNADGSRIKA